MAVGSASQGLERSSEEGGGENPGPAKAGSQREESENQVAEGQAAEQHPLAPSRRLTSEPRASGLPHKRPGAAALRAGLGVPECVNAATCS